MRKRFSHAHALSLTHNGTAHLEQSNHSGALLSEIILGGQDGLVNTLGVILGLAAASSDFRIIVAGGLAGAIAEAVSMGAVGYTSKLAESEYYESEVKREQYEMRFMPEAEKQEIRDIYVKKGFKGDLLEQIVDGIVSDERVWLDTMMIEELNLAPIDGKKPLRSAILIGFTALLGALIPLLPFGLFYYLGLRSEDALFPAILTALGVSALALFIVGAVKSRLTVGIWYRSGLQMLFIGIVSALAGYGIGLLFS